MVNDDFYKNNFFEVDKDDWISINQNNIINLNKIFDIEINYNKNLEIDSYIEQPKINLNMSKKEKINDSITSASLSKNESKMSFLLNEFLNNTLNERDLIKYLRLNVGYFKKFSTKFIGFMFKIFKIKLFENNEKIFMKNNDHLFIVLFGNVHLNYYNINLKTGNSFFEDFLFDKKIIDKNRWFFESLTNIGLFKVTKQTLKELKSKSEENNLNNEYNTFTHIIKVNYQNKSKINIIK